MIKAIKGKNIDLSIDLTGCTGNAFYLLGYARELCRKLEKSEEETESILKEMKSSDYANLIQVFDDYFGDFVILYI